MQSLIPHPAHPQTAITSLRAHIRRTPDTLAVTYKLAGDLSQIRLPAPSAPKRADELWQTTCFELFLKPAGADAYLEFNFAPSTQWAAYRFTSERDGMEPLADLEPAITVQPAANTLFLAAGFQTPPDLPPQTTLAANLTAVIEDTEGAKTYWALHHPLDKPDFHHPDGFVLDV